jgi:hypothetical protein
MSIALMWLAGCAAEPASRTTRVVSISDAKAPAEPVVRGRVVIEPDEHAARPPAEPSAAVDAAETGEPIVLCSVNVPGVYAEASPFDGGMGVVITTTQAGAVDALRHHAHALASNNRSYALGEEAPATSEGTKAKVDDDPYGKVEDTVGKRGKLVAVRVTVQDIEGGAFMIVAARAPHDHGQLASRIRDDVAKLTEGKCEASESVTAGLGD